MTNAEKIRELIKEADKYSFQDNCYTVQHGTYSKAGVNMQAWIAECEDLIITHFGKDSSPWRVFSRFNRDSLDGNYQARFDSEKNIIISALSSCLRIEPKITSKQEKVKTLNKSQVFIVHGHDEEAKSKTARFIEKLGLEAIILHEQASSSQTIIEKIEEYSDVGFGIVLYTPCDIGARDTKTPEYKKRARQNVVFEHGFLIGKLKRKNVCALVKGTVEIPNDISGVVYVDMDKADAWMYTIAKEMKVAGYNIDMNNL